QSAAGLLAEKDKIQKEIKDLEDELGAHSPIAVSGTPLLLACRQFHSQSCVSSDLGLSPSVDSCLQMNLVYQQVVQETLDQLEKLLTQNQKEQVSTNTQLQTPTNSSYQHPMKMYLGRFLKPYFKDKLTGLGPPANPEAREKASRIAGCLDDKKLKMKRWESWQKTLLIHAVSREGLRRLIQPKLSKVDYLSQKLLSAEEADRQLIREQIDNLEREIDSLRLKEEEMIGDRYEEYDWQKISNIDFEGTREAGDIRCFWQNFLHPSINKTRWSQEEVQRLKEISMRYGERNWEAVALELGTGRTAFMCLQMYQRFVSGSLKRGSWTPAEDALLRELVDKMRIGNFIPYTQMSYFMDGRDPSQLIYRWNQVLDPSLKKGPWTKQEDKLLLQAVARHGEKNWWKIRLEVPGRTDGGCRDRYYDCLKAETKRGPFDRKERELLLELVEKHGVGHWAKIAAEIPNRTDAQCMRTWRQMVKVSDEVNHMLFGSVIQLMIQPDSDLQDLGEEEESEDEYTFPAMQEWIPVEKAQPFTFLNFRPVVLVSSNEAHNDNFVRSTIVGKFGRSVIVGPQPRELQWEERHNSSAMMMVSPDQLRAHLHHQARRFNRKAQCKGKNTKTSKPLFMKGMTAQGIDLMLQAAVTPWIGNLLIPASTRTTAIDVLRERGEKKGLSSTSIFKLFLQVTNVDVIGCKEMIEQRQNGVMFLTPPPDPSSVKFKNANTVAGILQRIKLEMQKLPEVDRWQRQTPRSRLLPLMPPQNQPRLVLQVPPNISPQVAPMPFPQAASIPHSVLQLNAASSPAQHTSPHAGVTISPLPALSTCQTLTTPPVFVVPMLQNIAPTCSQQAVPLTQSLTASLPPFLNQPFSVGSTHAAVLSSAACPSQNCLSPTTLKPPRERGQMENHESQNRVAEVIKTTMSAPLKTASIQSSNFSSASPLPPHQLCSAPIQQVPQTVCSSKATSFTAPAVDVISSSSLTSLHLTPDDSSTSVNLSVPPPQSDTPSCSDRAVPSSLNHSLVPLPSSLTSPCPPDCFSSDHNYPFLTPGPTPIQHGSDLSHLCLVSKHQSPPPPHVQFPTRGLRPLAPKPSPVPVPINLLNLNQSHPLLAPPSVQSTVQDHGCYSLPFCPQLSSTSFSRRGTVKVDPPEPRPFRKVMLQIDPSLMFLEPQASVHDWLSGSGGVVVPGEGEALPYLPPFVSNLSTLSALLRAKKSLLSLHLNLHSDHLQQQEKKEEEEEEEQVEAVRQLVAERFSSNPAYRLLKARFLSCFTVPALLATLPPVRKVETCQTNQEQEEEAVEGEEEVDLKKLKEMAKRRRAEVASASHFSGIMDVTGPTTDKT
uniref:Small nuclear RNA activating complex, polypeptide 4 n=1 Tax=Amphilophus citrinellus TaxID=61819 RepID=A0A3Q0RRR9_AMPCI